MNDHEVRGLFDTVLTAPPPDLIDIDAAIRTGRHRRQRTVAVLLSAAALIVVLSVAAATVLPRGHREPVTPAAAGVPVTSTQQILGSWATIELDGQAVSTVLGAGDRPLGVTFDVLNDSRSLPSGVSPHPDVLQWHANDIINGHNGTFTLSENGRFEAVERSVTAVGYGSPLTAKDRLGLRNAEVVPRATQVRLVTSTNPPQLLLFHAGKVVAIYQRTPP